MDAPIKQSYRNTTEGTLVIYDVRIPGAAERFHSERAAWGEFGDIEALDEHHYILMVRPGGAGEMVA